MIVPDSNLILYAYNTASQQHVAAKQWWENLLSGNEPVGLVHPVIFSFLRVSTNLRAFSKPMSFERSAELIQAWCDRKIIRVIEAGRSHISETVNLLAAADSTGGNMVIDAQIAAIAKEHNATVHTADRDFMRFKGVMCYYPLDAD